MSGAFLTQFTAEYMSRLLHEFVAVAAAFAYAGFEATGTVTDFARSDLLK